MIYETDMCDSNVVHHETVRYVQENLPAAELLTEAAELFRVFGDPTRSKIICALAVSEMCVCDIAFLLGMTSSAISHQLRILKQSRIVKSRRDGKNVYYSLDDDHISGLFNTAIEHASETR